MDLGLPHIVHSQLLRLNLRKKVESLYLKDYRDWYV